MRSAVAEAAAAEARAELAASATASMACSTMLAESTTGAASTGSNFRRGPAATAAAAGSGLRRGARGAAAAEVAAAVRRSARRAARATARCAPDSTERAATGRVAAKGTGVARDAEDSFHLVLDSGASTETALADGASAFTGDATGTIAGTITGTETRNSGGSAMTTKRRVTRDTQPECSTMPITGSSIAWAVLTRTRARSAPAISTVVRTAASLRRRSPTDTSAATHSGLSNSPLSRRSWTTKSRLCPSTTPEPGMAQPAAPADAEATNQIVARNRERRG